MAPTAFNSDFPSPASQQVATQRPRFALESTDTDPRLVSEASGRGDAHQFARSAPLYWTGLSLPAPGCGIPRAGAAPASARSCSVQAATDPPRGRGAGSGPHALRGNGIHAEGRHRTTGCRVSALHGGSHERATDWGGRGSTPTGHGKDDGGDDTGAHDQPDQNPTHNEQGGVPLITKDRRIQRRGHEQPIPHPALQDGEHRVDEQEGD